MKKLMAYISALCALIMLFTAFAACAPDESESEEPQASLTPEELDSIMSGYTQWSLYSPDTGVTHNEFVQKLNDKIQLPEVAEDANAQIVMLGTDATLPNGSTATLIVNRHYSLNTLVRFTMKIGDREYSQNIESSYVDPNYAYVLILGADRDMPKDVLLVVSVGSVIQISSMMYKNVMTFGEIKEVRADDVVIMSQRMNVLGTRYATAEFAYSPQEYAPSFVKLSGMWTFDDQDYSNVALSDIEVTMVSKKDKESKGTLSENTRFALTETDGEKVYFETEDGDTGYFEYSIGSRLVNGMDEAELIGYQPEADGEVQGFQYK